MHRLMTLIAASIAVAGYCVPAAFAQNAAANLAPPAAMHPPANLDADTLRAQFTRSQLGLKPQSGATTTSGIALPFGLSYNRDAKGLIMPLDEKSEWGVGVGLNVNSEAGVDPVSNPLGLAPKRTPGLMLHKKF